MADLDPVPRVIAVLSGLARDIPSFQSTCALVGGLAVSARSEPRFTRDIDIAAAVRDDEAAETFVRGLVGLGYRVVNVLEQSATGRMAAVRILPPGEPGDGIVVDVLFASSGVEPEIVGEASRLEVAPRVVIPVAQVGHLVALKLLARSDSRPQDAWDLRLLAAVATTDEIARAARAVALIEARGFHRGRNLHDALDAWEKQLP